MFAEISSATYDLILHATSYKCLFPIVRSDVQTCDLALTNKAVRSRTLVNDYHKSEAMLAVRVIRKSHHKQFFFYFFPIFFPH